MILPSDPNHPYYKSEEYKRMQRNYREGWQRQAPIGTLKAERPSAEDEYYTSGDYLAER